MPKIYVDTSRLIGFYEAAEINAVQIEELEKYKTSLVLLDQTITELRPNRVNKLTRLRNEFQKEINATRPKTVAIIQRLNRISGIDEYV